MICPTYVSQKIDLQAVTRQIRRISWATCDREILLTSSLRVGLRSAGHENVMKRHPNSTFQIRILVMDVNI